MQHRARQCLIVLAGLAIPFATATAAHASGDPDYTAVPPQTAPKAPPPPAATTPPSVSSTNASSTPVNTTLPVTGSDITEMALIGAGLVVGGSLVLRARRHALS